MLGNCKVVVLKNGVPYSVELSGKEDGYILLLSPDRSTEFKVELKDLKKIVEYFTP